MDIDLDPDPHKEQKADLSLCIICQEKNDEDLVENRIHMKKHWSRQRSGPRMVSESM